MLKLSQNNVSSNEDIDKLNARTKSHLSKMVQMSQRTKKCILLNKLKFILSGLNIQFLSSARERVDIHGKALKMKL